jgi:ECF transporter S component (folate family)
MKKLQSLVFIALLVATEIILTRYCAIQTTTIRIGFGFIPIALAAMLYGPLTGGIVAMLADILGMLIFPKGPYFPGFTISAFVGGFIYGVILYKKSKNILNILLAVLLVTIIKDITLNTIWLTLLYKLPFKAIIIERIIKSIVMLAVQIAIIPIVWKRIGITIQKLYLKKV